MSATMLSETFSSDLWRLTADFLLASFRDGVSERDRLKRSS